MKKRSKILIFFFLSLATHFLSLVLDAHLAFGQSRVSADQEQITFITKAVFEKYKASQNSISTFVTEFFSDLPKSDLDYLKKFINDNQMTQMPRVEKKGNELVFHQGDQIAQVEIRDIREKRFNINGSLFVYNPQKPLQKTMQDIGKILQTSKTQSSFSFFLNGAEAQTPSQPLPSVKDIWNNLKVSVTSFVRDAVNSFRFDYSKMEENSKTFDCERYRTQNSTWERDIDCGFNPYSSKCSEKKNMSTSSRMFAFGDSFREWNFVNAMINDANSMRKTFHHAYCPTPTVDGTDCYKLDLLVRCQTRFLELLKAARLDFKIEDKNGEWHLGSNQPGYNGHFRVMDSAPGAGSR